MQESILFTITSAKSENPWAWESLERLVLCPGFSKIPGEHGHQMQRTCLAHKQALYGLPESKVWHGSRAICSTFDHVLEWRGWQRFGVHL